MKLLFAFALLVAFFEGMAMSVSLLNYPSDIAVIAGCLMAGFTFWACFCGFKYIVLKKLGAKNAGKNESNADVPSA